MKRILTIILLTLFNIYFTNCQRKKEDLTTIDFLAYRIDDLEGINSEGHDGVYRNFDFNYLNGETYFILIPKIGTERWCINNKVKNSGKGYEIDAEICKKLNKKGFKELSKYFNIWVFHTDIKYLKKTPNMDSPYSPIIPRRLEVYFLSDKLNKWEVIDIFEIKNEEDQSNENNWRSNFIDSIIKKSNESWENEIRKKKSKAVISQKWYGSFSREFSEKFTDGGYSIWRYYFIIDKNKIIFKSDSEIEWMNEYIGLENENQLELYKENGVKPNYILKIENGKLYVKGDSFENNNEWLLFDRD